MLILIRGLPGSGKSTLAKQLVRHSRNKHFEADDFFVDENGVYRFDPERLKDAHNWCMDSAEDLMHMDRDIRVVVANTFTREWEMVPYVQIAQATKHACYVVECLGEYGSIHPVPQDAINRMRSRWTALDDLYYLHAEPAHELKGVAVRRLTFRRPVFGA